MTDPASTFLDYRKHAEKLHEEIVVFDSHVDILPTFAADTATFDTDGSTQFDLAKVRRGGIRGVVLTVATGAGRVSDSEQVRTRQIAENKFQLISDFLSRFSDRVELAPDPDRFLEITNAGKLAVVIGFQNAHPFAEDLTELDKWEARGIRQFAFTFIGNNLWADSARPYPYIGQGIRSSGLSAIGRRAVRRLNELGVIIDVSQVSAESLRDILEESNAPIIASHSAPRHLVDVDRNLTDNEISSIADKRGVVQVVAFGPYLKPLSSKMRAAVATLWKQYGLEEPRDLSRALSINDEETRYWPSDKYEEFLHEFHVVLELERPDASIRDLVDAIDHTVSVAGIDHVGISSDFNHSGGVLGWMNSGETPNVTAELLRRGYTKGQIEKLWGGNYMRAWREIRLASRR
ncbi:membrane dipeptidase [Rhizobium sp. Rhizsp82]|uniref:membrane dipeptidase n=1 Tax=Rhizobium sp. Rhizsp82 TaxID=3243057 RepID=UPI0039B60A8F